MIEIAQEWGCTADVLDVSQLFSPIFTFWILNWSD